MEARSKSLKPVHLKILVLLERVGVLSSRRIAEILDVSRDPIEKKLELLESTGLARMKGIKPFRIGRAANFWELTEAGGKFVNNYRNKGELLKVKLSEMNEELKTICIEIMKLLERPLSFEELDRSLELSGMKARKYKLSDALKLLEAAGLIKLVQGHKEIKVLEEIGATKISHAPGGVMVYMKTDGADLNSAEL